MKVAPDHRLPNAPTQPTSTHRIPTSLSRVLSGNRSQHGKACIMGLLDGGLMDALEVQAEAMAARVGIAPEQVRAVIATLKEKLGLGQDQQTAITETAQETGVPRDKITDLLGQIGGGDLASKVGHFAKSLLG